MSLSLDQMRLAAAVARGLALDSIATCKSGHLGLPLGAAEIGAALFGSVLRVDPGQPRWLNRDRFVLSAGHGSMFLYAWLHLAGFELTLDDLRDFRKLGSRTPGHPEFGHTPGVEITSGPLGQGVANAVGLALSRHKAAGRWNTAQHPLLDWHVFCLAGDGCLQEGVALEATELAGHLGLNHLTLIWDANSVTLDAPAAVTQSQDVRARYEACGWSVVDVDGHDPAELVRVLEASRQSERPVLVIARTEIARGVPEVAGTPKGHGESGAAFRDQARQGLGLPAEGFQVPAELRAAFQARRRDQQLAAAAWEQRRQAWAAAEPARAAELARVVDGTAPALPACPDFDPAASLATRKAGELCLQHLAAAEPRLVSLSADLFGSNLNYIAGGGEIRPGEFAGRNLRAGIREHAMGALLNGLAYDGLFRPLGATFLVFSDYLRPSLRLSALAGLPVIWWFTHDSVGVGEDGPTHQPVEQIASLRLIPGLELYRPADPEETAAALEEALARRDGPTALALSRQALPMLPGSAAERRAGTRRGGYVALREESALELVLLATGSEVQWALAAARTLAAEGRGVRVLSLPCLERFAAQDAGWRDQVLPTACRRRLAVEAGSGAGWHRWTGLDGRVLSIERFGLSAPADQVMTTLGMSTAAVLAAARELLEA
ncbi:MAG: transketolase [Candidatus Delongbacteria bacterium]